MVYKTVHLFSFLIFSLSFLCAAGKPVVPDNQTPFTYTREQCRYFEALLTPQPAKDSVYAGGQYVGWTRIALSAIGASAITVAVVFGAHMARRICARIGHQPSLTGLPGASGVGQTVGFEHWAGLGGNHGAGLAINAKISSGLLWAAVAAGLYHALQAKRQDRESCMVLLHNLAAQWQVHRPLCPPPLWSMGDQLAASHAAGTLPKNEAQAERLARALVMHAMQLRLNLGPEPIEALWMQAMAA